MRFDRKEGGVAGLVLLLSLITMLFVIGLLVMIFSLMGQGMLNTGTIDNDSVAYQVINDTIGALASVIDWFPLFIVIGAMVVLILLTVIIIIAIRGSGLIAGGGPATA